MIPGDLVIVRSETVIWVAPPSVTRTKGLNVNARILGHTGDDEVLGLVLASVLIDAAAGRAPWIMVLVTDRPGWILEHRVFAKVS